MARVTKGERPPVPALADLPWPGAPSEECLAAYVAVMTCARFAGGLAWLVGAGWLVLLACSAFHRWQRFSPGAHSRRLRPKLQLTFEPSPPPHSQGLLGAGPGRAADV